MLCLLFIYICPRISKNRYSQLVQYISKGVWKYVEWYKVDNDHLESLHFEVSWKVEKIMEESFQSDVMINWLFVV